MLTAAVTHDALVHMRNSHFNDLFKKYIPHPLFSFLEVRKEGLRCRHLDSSKPVSILRCTDVNVYKIGNLECYNPASLELPAPLDTGVVDGRSVVSDADGKL